MISIWQKEAELGDAHAQFSLGSRYVAGYEVPQDIPTALNWFRKAAAQGHWRSQLAIGDILLSMPGIPGQEGEGVQWLHMAVRQLQTLALQGDASAMTELIKVYSGIYAQTKDLVEAYAWVHIAGALGDNGAAVMLVSLGKEMNGEQTAQATALAGARLAKIRQKG